MLHLSGVQQQQPLSRTRRCLYCNQKGCGGIQQCWWPRVRECRDAGALEAELARQTAAHSALEANLRSQIRVLEREVQLLRSGTQQRENIEKGAAAAHNVSVVPPIPIVTIPSFLQSTMQNPPPPPQQQQQISQPQQISCIQKQREDEHLQRTAHSALVQNAPLSETHRPSSGAHVLTSPRAIPLPCPPIYNKSPTSTAAAVETRNELRDAQQRIEELEHLVRVLAVQDVSLRQKMLSESPSPAVPEVRAAESLLRSQLSHAQEVADRYREELRHAKSALTDCEGRWRRAVIESEELRRQIAQRRHPMNFSSAAVQTDAVATQESSVATSMNSVDHQMELQKVRAQLIAAERKVIAWERWYHQQKNEQKEPPRRLKSRKTNGDFVKGSVAAAQQMPLAVERYVPNALPAASSSLSPSLCAALPLPLADALTIDTYALISRESTLREMALQEREDLMETLVDKSGRR